MGWKAFGAKWFAKYIAAQHRQWADEPIKMQKWVLGDLLRHVAHTKFGQDHHLQRVTSYAAFKERVPLRSYEQLRPYIEDIKAGETDVLWPGRPLYFSKTAGTTSGAKYIPITKESIPYHMKAARDATLMHAYHTSDARLFDGKMIFLSGNPRLQKYKGILTGRLSGIVHHHVPHWVLKNRLPSWEVNCLEDWEEKLSAIIEETLTADLRLISGIPPWVQMYFDWVYERTGQTMKEIWPNLQLLVHGGVNFAPYRSSLQKRVGAPIHFLETYPASEGFIAYQDIPENQQNQPSHKGLRLLINHGIFYEFVPAAQIFDDQPTRLSLEDVEKDKNYAIILHTNAGLWGYILGDTVKFVSLDPHRIIMTGRINHFISAFGEHVIAEEVDRALSVVAEAENADVVEFTVAPHVKEKEDEDAFHEWFVEFGDRSPDNLEDFARRIDQKLQEQNTYYKDLRQGNVLKPLRLNVLSANTFREVMKEAGRLGGQNKVPRLQNDRQWAKKLKPRCVYKVKP